MDFHIYYNDIILFFLLYFLEFIVKFPFLLS